MGWLLTGRGERPGDVLVPLGLLACALAYATTARGFSPAPASPSVASPWTGDVMALLRERRLLWLLAAGTMHTVCTVPSYQLFGVLGRQRGLPAGGTAPRSTAGGLR